MRILIADVLRSLVALNINNDPLYKKLKSKQLMGLTGLIDTRIEGWKMDKKPEVVTLFEELKDHVEKGHSEPALTLYETKIFPAVNKEFGPKSAPKDPKMMVFK